MTISGAFEQSLRMALPSRICARIAARLWPEGAASANTINHDAAAVFPSKCLLAFNALLLRLNRSVVMKPSLDLRSAISTGS